METTAPAAGESDSSFALRLRYCRGLPTLPAVALRLVNLAEQPDSTLQQFEDLISRDPALTGKLMRVANSSFYNWAREVSSLSQAVGFLGLNATVSLALSFSLHRSIATGAGDGFDATRYWRHALLTALAARTLATELGESQPEELFLTGLLQDIGVLAMDAIFGERYERLHAASAGHEELLQQEADTFGVNHADAGADLLGYWHFPQRIATNIRLSHDAAAMATPSATSASMHGLPGSVAIAARMAEAWVHGGTPESFAAIQEPAHAWLGVDATAFQRVISTMVQQIPELERLFETQLADPDLLASVEASASELRVMRDQVLLQGVTVAEGRVQVLEAHTNTLESQAQRDGMTGLYNRSYLDQQLKRVFEVATHEHRPLSVAFIDVDHFKRINDSFGHAVGDQVLRTVARRLLGESRQNDIVARYGGEEFVIVIADTSLQVAQVVVERMLAAVRDAPFHTDDGTRVQITFSAGIAGHMQAGRRHASAPELLDAADRALYAAKKAGRGRVVVASLEPPVLPD